MVIRLSRLIFSRLKERNPVPKCELEYANEYTFLVAIILSAQTTDKSVNRATYALFRAVDSPKKMVDLGVDRLKEYIKSLGLFNNKARYVIAMSEMLLDQFNGLVPHTLNDLSRLPGVGRKTAKVFRNSMLGEACVPVDRHVYRVSRRLGLSAASSILGVERDLEKNIAAEYLGHAHHWLVLHGRYICLAARPRCNVCPIRDLCCTYNDCSVASIVQKHCGPEP